MRIAVLCGGTYVGGTEVVALAVTRGLDARGHDVRVLANAWTNGDFPGRLDAAGIRHERVHIGKISLTLRSPYLGWTAAALVRLPGALLAARRWFAEFAPDVVIAHNRDTVLLLSVILRGRPLLFHMHEAPAPTRVARAMYRLVAAYTSTFLAVSEHVRESLLALGIPDTQTLVVHNGIEESSEAPAPPTATERPFTVGIVGQIGEWKGHDDLLAALALLRQRGISFQCEVVGEGTPAFVEHLHVRAEALGISDSIVWRGFILHARAMYSALDVCVVPTRIAEAFGMVAVEAGVAGIPVVASNTGGLREIVEDGVTGFLVEPQRPDQLADRLAQLAASPSLRSRLGAAARARTLTRFTADRMVDAIEDACERAIAAHAAGKSGSVASTSPI